MVKTNMSTDGSENEFDSLASTRDKLKIQQRLIDLSARSLQSTRLSSRDFSPGSYSSSGEAQSTLEENILLLENKLMKGFGRQLILKHQYLKQVEEEDASVEEAEKELDKFINLELFLNVAGLEPRSIKALLSEDLSLDVLFSMPTPEIELLARRHRFPAEELRKTLNYLGLLTSYYEKWERGEKPTASPFDRLNSTSSRLSSISTLGSFDQDRTDSCSSYLNSPFSSIPTSSYPHTHTSSTPNTSLLTPSQSHSLLSPINIYPHPVNGASTSSYNSSGYSYQTPTLNRSYSSSSSMLLGEEESQTSYGYQNTSSSDVKPSRKLSWGTHRRTHSNPLANIVINPDLQQQGGRVPSRFGRRSPTPPTRSGSHPSIVSHSTLGSPSATTKNKSHPQMRRIIQLAPTFSQSISNDQLMPSLSPVAPESPVFRPMQSVYGEPPVRSNSMASYEPRRAKSSGPMLKEITSTSMVDLPITMASSSERLDQIDEYPSLPKSGKSQSVPRLTLMTVSSESDRSGQSTSMPTSPRTPGTYTPTGVIGHAICHRFSNKTFLTPHVCDLCKKTLIFGVKCKHCRYKCHKSCAVKAPLSCGLPRELVEFFRKQFLLNSPSTSLENFMGTLTPRPLLEKRHTIDEVSDTQDQFIIQDLTKEPTKGNFSPVMSQKKKMCDSNENGYTRPFFSRVSTSSLLEVPPTRHPGVFRSTSSSPSTTPPTSPSLTPSSPRSPVTNYNGTAYTYPSPRKVPAVVYTDESTDEESYDGEMGILSEGMRILSEDDSCSPYSSKDSSVNDISDVGRMHTDSPRGLRPSPQIIMAQSLPDLLLPQGRKSTDSSDRDSPGLTNGYASDDNLLRQHQKLRKKESLLSTTDSKASTLVASLPTEAEDEGEGILEDIQGDYRERKAMVRHRNSVVDEWNIPYDDIKLHELVGRGPLGEVYRGYWHGEVAIKRFCLQNEATPEQLIKFKEEVSVLKKIRHENLSLFMGASLTPPNLAIITSFCKGHTLYKHIHLWSENFYLEKSVNIAKQVAVAMGYLHARGIVHKNLNTKNIFLDKDKVVITDTGLSSLSDNIYCEFYYNSGWPRRRPKCAGVIPRTKLYYLAPEIMRILSSSPQVRESGDLYPYSNKTDIYAFSTVLYELVTRKFPFLTDSLGFALDTTTVIFQVGRGQRQEIQSREVPKRLQDLIWDCWHPEPKRRLPFSTIWDILTKLSRKKTPIVRSPSFPITLSRSTESLRVI